MQKMQAESSDMIESENSPFNVSFIIPALNEVLMLNRLLDSIDSLVTSSMVSVCETILVDASSTDGTAELARSRGCKIVETQPGHVSISRNLGASEARGNILAFIDADCELPPEWLIAVAGELSKADVIATGARMENSELDTTWIERAWFELAHRQQTTDSFTKKEWLATFNLAVQKSSFFCAGGFDESLTTCEDVEFGYRLAKFGALHQINSCGVIHNGESKTILEFYNREAWRARGALQLLRHNWHNPRELMGFLMPFIITVGLVSSCALLLLNGVLPDVYAKKHFSIIAVAIGPFPLMLLLFRRKVSLRGFAPCAIVLVVYFYARMIGSLSSFKRVERK